MCKKLDVVQLNIPMSAPGAKGGVSVIVDLSSRNPILNPAKEEVLVDPLFQVSTLQNSANYTVLSKYGITPYALSGKFISRLSMKPTTSDDPCMDKEMEAMLKLQAMFGDNDVIRFNDLRRDDMWHVWTVGRYMQPAAITGAKLYYDHSQHAILHYLNVLDEFRGMGIGSAILSYMNAHAAMDTVLVDYRDYVTLSALITQYYYPISMVGTEEAKNILVMRRDCIGATAGPNMSNLQINWALWVAQLCQDNFIGSVAELSKENCIDEDDRDNALEIFGENNPYANFLFNLTDNINHAQTTAIIRRLISLYNIDRVASKILDRAAWIQSNGKNDMSTEEEYRRKLMRSLPIDVIEGCTLPNNYHLYGRDHYSEIPLPTGAATKMLMRPDRLIDRDL